MRVVKLNICVDFWAEHGGRGQPVSLAEKEEVSVFTIKTNLADLVKKVNQGKSVILLFLKIP